MINNMFGKKNQSISSTFFCKNTKKKEEMFEFTQNQSLVT